jgi:hypothetical protein
MKGNSPLNLNQSKAQRWLLAVTVSAAVIGGMQTQLSAKAPKVRDALTLTYAHFQRLDRGMDEAQVIAILGRPVGIAKPDYSEKGSYDKDLKTDQTGYCFVYKGVIGEQHTLYNEDEWMVAFSNNRVIFWGEEMSCVKFF